MKKKLPYSVRYGVWHAFLNSAIGVLFISLLFSAIPLDKERILAVAGVCQILKSLVEVREINGSTDTHQ